MKSILKSRWWGVMLFFAVTIAISAVVPYMTFNRTNFSPIFNGRLIGGGEIWLYIHVIGGGLSLLLGGFQFWTWLREKHRNIHRWIGRLYFFAGVFPASIAGLIIAQDTVAGFEGRVAFSLLAIFWFGTAAIALRAVLQHDIETHQRWMIRNFSLTFAAVTLRLWLFILIMIQMPFVADTQLRFNQAYQIVPWLCWIPNLLFAEMLIRNRIAKGNGAIGIPIRPAQNQVDFPSGAVLSPKD